MSLELPILERDVYTVSRLNREVRQLLEGSFPLIWVQGELSNLSRPASGHVYFSLKDANAQVRCALFRNRVMLAGTPPIANGQQLLVRARISLYEPRGDFQLLIEYLEEAGAGVLRLAFEELRQRLAREGLFDIARKRPLPRFPHRIGVITSPTGAAVRDVLSVLSRRFPALPVLLYAVAVQGAGAGAQIARAIELASQRQECDVLLLVRGGGSLEDLWAFNEEGVARAIHACRIPLVSGVGHEIDVTIADFAADMRAPTPSAAAELVSPDRLEWLHKFTLLEQGLSSTLRRQLDVGAQRLLALERRLAQQQPSRRLQDRAQRLDELEQRWRRAMQLRLEQLHTRLVGLTSQLRMQAPAPLIQRWQERCQMLNLRLETAMRHRLEQNTCRLAEIAHTLHTVSPLQTLGRGYAIVRRYPQGEIIRRATQVQVDNTVEALLGEGRLLCRVEKVESL
jgi:exodeoxyribonuclease VII large subunit